MNQIQQAFKNSRKLKMQEHTKKFLGFLINMTNNSYLSKSLEELSLFQSR